ncbi:MAG: hypothetical protein WAV26_01760 [Candidatus Deferrimicrobium sp.]
MTIRSLVDCLIAAIAVESGATVLYKDRDYESMARYAPLNTVSVE